MNAPWWSSTLVGVVLLLILAAVVGLSALILWLRDRGESTGYAMRRTLGLVSLVVGFAIAGWVILSLLSPDNVFEGSAWNVVQVCVVVGLVYVGWEWLIGPGIDDVPITLSPEETERSISRARATLPRLVSWVGTRTESEYIFIKFPLTRPDGRVEHIWAAVGSYQDGCLQAYEDYDVWPSESQSVPLEHVEDWYVACSDGRITGDYGRIALFENYEASGKTLTPKMRKEKARLIDAQRGESS